MFDLSENRGNGKYKRENMKDFGWKECLVGKILEETSLGHMKNKIK